MTDRDASPEEERLDPAVVAALYARHAGELRAYLTGLLRDRHLAEEVLQAVYVKALERGDTVRGDSLKAWLFRVAHNEATDRRRRAAAEVRSVRAVAWWKREAAPAADRSAVTRETIDLVRKAVESLPPEQREVVRLRIHEDKTFAQIAAATGKPLGTILTRMRLATKKLAEALRREYEP